MEHHGQQEPPRLPAARTRTKDPSYHVFAVHLTNDRLIHLTSDGPVKEPNVEEAVKRAAGPIGEEPEEFFVILGDQLKRVKRRPEKAEVFD